MQRSHSSILVCFALFCAGCAHYGWAGGTDSPSVAVDTIRGPAELGIDEAALTRHLVASLKDRGLRATWGLTGTTKLTCTVESLNQSVVGSSMATITEEVRLTCAIASPEKTVDVSRDSLAQATLSGDLTPTRQEVRLSAALRAVDRLAGTIEREIRGH